MLRTLSAEQKLFGGQRHRLGERNRGRRVLEKPPGRLQALLVSGPLRLCGGRLKTWMPATSAGMTDLLIHFRLAGQCA